MGHHHFGSRIATSVLRATHVSHQGCTPRLCSAGGESTGTTHHGVGNTSDRHDQGFGLQRGVSRTDSTGQFVVSTWFAGSLPVRLSLWRKELSLK